MAAKKKIKFINVSVGERVNYVMKDGQIRPLDIVRVWNDQGTVNGVLLIDGANDNGNVPFLSENAKVPTAVQSFDPHVEVYFCNLWATNVIHDESKKPGTWHFGETEVEEEDEEEPAKPPATPPAQPAAPATTSAPNTGNQPANGGNGK